MTDRRHRKGAYKIIRMAFICTVNPIHGWIQSMSDSDTYNIILELFIFWLKYNGLGTVRRTTKLIEGGHRGLQAYRPICYYFYVFYVCFTFFSKSKKSWPFTFFAVSHTFSRTMAGMIACLWNEESATVEWVVRKFIVARAPGGHSICSQRTGLLYSVVWY